MGMSEQSHQGTTAGRALAEALEIKGKLGEIAAEPAGYVEALQTIAALCQEALSENECDGEAQVLLADAFYLLHLKSGNDLPLRLAAATIQHWSDRRLCPDSLTIDAGTGCRLHELVARAIAATCLDCAESEEREMRYLERELYATALVTQPAAWMAA